MYATFLRIALSTCFLMFSEASFLVHLTEYTYERNVARTHFMISGEGIEDSLVLHYKDGRSTAVKFIDGHLIIGEHGVNVVSAISEKGGSLVVIELLSGRCERRVYKPEYQVKNIEPGECNSIKEKMTRLLSQRRQQILEEPIADNNAGVNVLITEKLFNSCEGTIEIVGSGGTQYKQTLDCVPLEEMEVTFTSEGVILGNRKKTGESHYTVKPGVLITVQDDGTCKKTISRRELTQYHSSWTVEGVEPMDMESCDEAVKTVDKYMGFDVYRYSHFKDDKDSGSCEQDLVMRGQEVAETLIIPCAAANTLMASYAISTGLLVGDLRSEGRLMAYSDNPGTLMVIQGTRRTCERYTYRDGKREVQPLLSNECWDAKLHFDSLKTQVSRGQVPPEGHFNELLIEKLQSHLENKVCYQNITINGNGVEEIVHVECETAKKLQLRFIPNGFILCDFVERRWCMVMDSRRSVVRIVGRECTRDVYRGSQVKASWRLNSQLCDALDKKIDYFHDLTRSRPFQPVQTSAIESLTRRRSKHTSHA